MFTPRQSYTFEDIGIIPTKLSQVETRKNVNTESKFCGIRLTLPVCSSPMVLVTGEDMTVKMREVGGLGILPRTEDPIKDLELFKKVFNKIGNEVFVSIPSNGDAIERFLAFTELGAKNFCIDVANGFSVVVERIVNKLVRYEGINIVTGNVASVEGFKFLSELGVQGVRCGVGNGSICLTSAKTAIGVGQASLIREVAEWKYANNVDTKIICDGGVRGSADVIKAIALGADLVWSGKMFAACKESPSVVVKYDGKLLKQYGGQASKLIKKNDSNIEGDDSLIPYTGSVDRVWKILDKAFRSAMSYLDCHKLETLICLPDENFVLLSNAAKIERTFHV